MSDAFEALTPPDPEPVAVEFAARLRMRVERALVPDVVLIPAATTNGRNDRMPQVITPYLCVHDAAAAIDWYRASFGAQVSNVIEWEGNVGHAELDVAGAVFYLSDEAPSLGVVSPRSQGPGVTQSNVLHVAVVDEFVARAVAGGAEVQRPIEEAHGSRNAWILDPFGHRWNVATPTRTPAEIAARRAPSEPYYMTLTTADVERGAAFYGAVFGWEFGPEHNGGRHVTNTEMPIGLRPPANPFTTTEPGQIEMWFTVRDFDDAVERVRIAGGTVASVTGYDSGREAICEDDQGITFKMSEPAPGYDR
jgi:uncharacterized glyoxalase superfamily protein PhnB